MHLNDEYYMKKALQLARRGLGKTSPNPMVGAVIVRDGQIIGQGYHRQYGGPHAEVEAVQDAGGDINGGTLYVTLEPCCHHGKKTPPCLDMLLQYDLKRVVIGVLDPNPSVNGKSVEALRQRGIETTVGVRSEECDQLNEVFFKWVKTGMPFITLKYAQSIDGKIAATGGDSKWISSEPSLGFAHKLRGMHDAVMVGIGTILADDPQLTVRRVKGRSPLRVILDRELRIPQDSRILQDQDIAPTTIATTSKADSVKLSFLRKMDVDVLVIKEDEKGMIDLEVLFKKLGEMNVSSVLVEGGSGIATSLIKQNLVDKFIFVVAPKIMGKGIEAVGDLGIHSVSNSIKLTFRRTYRSGSDFIIEARPAG